MLMIRPRVQWVGVLAVFLAFNDAVGADPPSTVTIANAKRLPTEPIRVERVPLGEADDYKPCIAQLPSGELLLTAFHQHKKEGNKVLEQTLLFRSKDGGRNWSTAQQLDLLGREPYLTVLRDGTIFITGHLLANDVRNKWGHTCGFLHRSTDSGKTWESIRVESDGAKPKASSHTTRNVLELADGTLLLGVDYDGGDGPYLLWRSKDKGKTWDKTGKCQPKNFKSKYGFFGGETWLWQAKSGKIWAMVRVDSTELPIKDKPIRAKNDQADHFILFSSTDEGKTFDRIRDFGDYGEMYMSLLRLNDRRLLLTFTVRDLKPPLGVRAIVGNETDDDFEFDFARDRIMLETRTRVGKYQGGGFGPTVQLKDGTLVTSYSYRGEDDKTHVEVVRWNLPLDVGLNKQLFVDDYIVEAMSNLTRELGKVTRANEGKPIFTDGWFYGTVLHDEGKFKLWYRKPDNKGFGYAESSNGLSFEKKADLKGIRFAGDFTMAVEIDTNAPDRKFRFLGCYDAPGMAAGLAHSADGITWTPYNKGKPITKRAADTYNQVLFDPLERTYRLFTRTDFGTPGGGGEIRGTRSMTNPDVHLDPTRWKLVREWIFNKEGKDETKRRQIYAVTCWIYQGVYFALLSVYEYPGDLSEGKMTNNARRHERDVMNFYIATSRDGDSWDLRWVYAGQPLVPRGSDGAFDQDLVLPASTIVTHQDKHWIYYAGGNERHGTDTIRFNRKHAIGLVTLPLDRFVGLTAGDRMGTVLTKPFVLIGEKLELNIDAGKGGVTVEVLDANGELRASASGKFVNDLHWQPPWNNEKGLAGLRGRTVQLRFHLSRASLYAFAVR